MVFQKVVRAAAPMVARRLAGAGTPWPAQPARTIFSPWPRSSAIGALIRDMDRLERHVFRDAPFWFSRPSSAILPINAVHDADGNLYRVSVDLAGFAPEEIKLALDDAGRRLTISARCDRRGADGSRTTQEVTRVIALPDTVDTANMTSVLHEDGVLALEAPLKEQSPQLKQEPQRIPISRTGSGQQEATPQAQQEKADSTSS